MEWRVTHGAENAGSGAIMLAPAQLKNVLVSFIILVASVGGSLRVAIPAKKRGY